MIVVGVTADYGLGSRIAEHMGAKYCRFFSKVFPDGESYLRLDENVRGEDVLLVQSMAEQQDKRFTEMLMAIDAIAEAHANNIYGLIPYMAYARQDRRFLDGEPISARSVLGALHNAGMSKLAVIEPHKEEELSYFKGKSIAIDVMKKVVRGAVEKTGAETLVAPDSGVSGRVKGVAEELGVGWDYLEKKRDRNNGSLSIGKGLGDLSGKKILVVDDMISTGGTIVQASGEAMSKGAIGINAAAVHLILADGAYDRIKNAGVGNIFGSNSTGSKGCEMIDVSEDVAAALSQFLVD